LLPSINLSGAATAGQISLWFLCDVHSGEGILLGIRKMTMVLGAFLGTALEPTPTFFSFWYSGAESKIPFVSNSPAHPQTNESLL
jgi:hypothetical protein